MNAKTIKLAGELTTIYTMRDSEVEQIVDNLINTAQRICTALHTAQCEAVENSAMTPAARVEYVLQLSKLTATVERASLMQCRTLIPV